MTLPVFRKRFLFGPNPACPWASKMALNPALAPDPERPGRLHMLFRVTGPAPEYRRPGQPPPYPIGLAYAVSDDDGETWTPDWSRPALGARLHDRNDARLRRTDIFGRTWLDYTNGAVEDPRLFPFDGAWWLSVACRLFAPGPYWEHDDPLQCQPSWVAKAGLGTAATENATVSLLFRVDLAALGRRDYDKAFAFAGPLHPPDTSDDRDVVLFPRRLRLDGRDRIVCLHRPKYPWRYPEGAELAAPSMFLAAADRLEDFALPPGPAVRREVLLAPTHPWEKNRVGASWAPLELEDGRWIVPYHGKQDDTVGYTQSFLLVEERPDGFPRVAAHPSERLLYASEPWELTGDFTIPCLFTCSGLVRPDGRLVMAYGAADQKVGWAETDAETLWTWVRAGHA